VEAAAAPLFHRRIREVRGTGLVGLAGGDHKAAAMMRFQSQSEIK
jgi:hypothetical protein